MWRTSGMRSTGRHEIDHRIRCDPGKGELGGSARDDLVLQWETPRACDVRFPLVIDSAHPNAQPLDLAPAVVDQMQSRPSGIAREAADDDLAPVDPQRSLLIRELTTDLEGEATRIGGLFARVLRSPDPDGDRKSRGRRLDDLKQEVASGEQIHHLARDGRS